MIHVILCCYYTTPAEMLARANSLFARWQDVHFEIYSTNPAHANLPPPGVPCHGVANEFNDFSAYIRACGDLVESGSVHSAGRSYIFLNDTLFTRHPGRLLLRLFKRTLPIVRSSDFPVLSGRADSYRTLLQTSPFAPGLDQYVSTFFFATNAAGVRLLNELFTSQRTLDMMRSAASLERGALPEKFFAFLQLHMRSEGTRFSWPGAKSGTDAGRKAVCVLLEHLLSAHFFENGFVCPLNSSPLLDVLLWGAYKAYRGGAP